MKKTHKAHIIYTIIACAVALGSYSPTTATEFPANGYFLRVGAGYSPYASTDLRGDIDGSLGETSEGAVASLLLGHVWNHVHSFELRWQNIYLAGASQGTIGVSYTRYMRLHGPSPFLSIGFGLQRGPFLSSISNLLETDDGAALLLGAGLRFSTHLEFALDYSRGSTNRFIGTNTNFDLTHKQLAFSLRYVLWGE